MVRLTVVLKQHGSTVADNESIRIFAQCQDVRFLYLPFFFTVSVASVCFTTVPSTWQDVIENKNEN